MLALTTLLGCLFLAAPAQAGTVRLQQECPNCGGAGGLVLLWRGDPGEANRITVERAPEGGAMLVRETGEGATLTSASSHCTVQERVARCEQPDTFYVFLYGEDGNDELSTNALDGSFSDWFFGGPGDDTLDTGDHSCCIGARMTGGPGDDTFLGGTGMYDEAVYYEREAPLDVSLAPRAPGARNGEVGERDVLAADMDGLWGGRGDDVLTGDDGDNYIWTGEGHDLVRMGDGRDVQWGDSWYDQGLDEIHGEGGDDHFYPGPKPGVIVGGPGTDQVYLDNFVPAWFSRLSLDGKANDGGIMRSDTPDGERNVPAGNLLEVESLSGNNAADVLIGDAGPNVLEGEGGPDIIKGAAGTDRIYGDGYYEDGDDFIHALDGEEDTVSCGGGLDVVLADLIDHLDECEQVSADDLPLPDLKLPELPPPPVVQVDVPPAPAVHPPPPGPPVPTETPTPLGPPPPPTLDDICRDVLADITGTRADDCLVGGARSDRISGAGGTDRLTGNRGNDRLRGGPGDDLLNGGAGEDRLYGDAGNDMLVGGPGRDRLSGGRGHDFLVAADGRADVVICGPGHDSAAVDRHDRVSGCEKVARARSRRR